MTLPEIINLILKERYKSIQKFGVNNWAPIEWLPILIEEVGEVSKEICEGYFKDYYPEDKNRKERLKKEIVQVAAVCVKMLETI